MQVTLLAELWRLGTSRGLSLHNVPLDAQTSLDLGELSLPETTSNHGNLTQRGPRPPDSGTLQAVRGILGTGRFLVAFSPAVPSSKVGPGKNNFSAATHGTIAVHLGNPTALHLPAPQLRSARAARVQEGWAAGFSDSAFVLRAPPRVAAGLLPVGNLTPQPARQLYFSENSLPETSYYSNAHKAGLHLFSVAHVWGPFSTNGGRDTT